jgi:uncharacterized protein (DUF4415 family)
MDVGGDHFGEDIRRESAQFWESSGARDDFVQRKSSETSSTGASHSCDSQTDRVQEPPLQPPRQPDLTQLDRPLQQQVEVRLAAHILQELSLQHSLE